MQVLACPAPSRPQSFPAHSALPCRHLVSQPTPLSTFSLPRARPLFCPGVFAVLAALTVWALAGVPLEAQTAHYGAVINLASGSFSTPTGVSVDASGNVYVADNGHSAVKEIVAVNGTIPASPVVNTLGSGFSSPFTVAVDGSGNVFVTDYGNHAVKEILAAGGYTTVKTLVSGTSFIFGSAVDASENVYYSEYGKNLIKKIVAINGVIPAAPKIITLGGGFNIPAGVAVDGSGNVFVGDQNNNAVKEILASSGWTTTVTVATGFSTPDGVAIDKYGNVFVANDGGNTVNEIVAVNGVIPASPTILTLGSGFLQPFDVAVDGNGNVYVADRGNNAVKEIQMAGGNFGPINVGTISPSPITMSFTFDTAGTLGSYAVVTQGVAGLDFYDAGGGTCIANTVYSAGAVCTVNVKFSPLAPGSRYGAVELLTTNGALLASGPLQGMGVGPMTTFAINPSGVYLPGVGHAVGSGLNGPGGVAVDASENIFVGDSNNNAVKEIVAAGGYTTVKTLGSGFSYPNGVAVDGGGNVYVADTYNDGIKEIVAVGGYTTVNSLGSGFSNPYGVAVDGSGNVFVADFANDAVKEILAVGGRIPATPSIRTLASGLDGPDGVAVDANGNVFFANYGDGSVREIVAVGGSIPVSPTIKTILSGLSGPSNLFVDGIGNVFISDTGNNEIKEIWAAGGYATVQVLGIPNGSFNYPEAVAVSWSGDVIVADTDNNAVELLGYADAPSLTFPNTAVGMSSASQSVTMTNAGNAPLSITSIATTGANASSFVIANNCGSTLAAGASCAPHGHFTPTTTGALAAKVTITDNAGGSPQTIGLSGTGTPGPAKVTLSAASLLFGSQTVGTSSASQAVTLTNTGGSTLNITSIVLGGANPSSFVFSNSCGSTLAAGANCSIHGHFTPTTTGPLTASIAITDSASGSPHTIALSGAGTSSQAKVALSTVSQPFGTQTVGASTASQVVTLTNTGGSTLTITSIVMGGANAASFVFANNCGSTLAAGASCSIHGHFTPTAKGLLTATITITDSASGPPQTIALSGTGQ
jgi:streptogramin lyase